jgi:hypothetical protein
LVEVTPASFSYRATETTTNILRGGVSSISQNRPQSM